MSTTTGNKHNVIKDKGSSCNSNTDSNRGNDNATEHEIHVNYANRAVCININAKKHQRVSAPPEKLPYRQQQLFNAVTLSNNNYKTPEQNNNEAMTHQQQCTFATIHVFSADRKALYEFPLDRVEHFFTGARGALVLCPHFAENGRCSRRSACRRVHAFARDAVSCTFPHVNFIYTMVGDCIYECYSPETLLLPQNQSSCEGLTRIKYQFSSDHMLVRVCTPREASEENYIPMERIIKTQVNIIGRQTPALCGHYFFSGFCSLGSACNFVHFVYVDPTVSSNRCELAPLCVAPWQLRRPTTANATNNSQRDQQQPTRPTTAIPVQPIIPIVAFVAPIVSIHTGLGEMRALTLNGLPVDVEP